MEAKAIDDGRKSSDASVGKTRDPSSRRAGEQARPPITPDVFIIGHRAIAEVGILAVVDSCFPARLSLLT